MCIRYSLNLWLRANLFSACWRTNSWVSKHVVTSSKNSRYLLNLLCRNYDLSLCRHRRNVTCRSVLTFRHQVVDVNWLFNSIVIENSSFILFKSSITSKCRSVICEKLVDSVALVHLNMPCWGFPYMWHPRSLFL